MEIVTSKYLASTGYRCLFECVKKEGIEPILNLVQDINNLSEKNNLVRKTIMGKENDLDLLAKKNKNIIKYLSEHEEELTKLSLFNENVLKTLTSLSNDITLLNLYLENAKKLEELKIEKITFGDINSFNAKGDRYYCEFYPADNNTLSYIYKCFTDGEVFPRLTKEQANNFKCWHTGFNIVCFSITNRRPHTFVLKTQNHQNLHQYREIDIRDFGFDGNKLPTEEEIQSYEIPKELIRK